MWRDKAWSNFGMIKRQNEIIPYNPSNQMLKFT